MEREKKASFTDDCAFSWFATMPSGTEAEAHYYAMQWSSQQVSGAIRTAAAAVARLTWSLKCYPWRTALGREPLRCPTSRQYSVCYSARPPLWLLTIVASFVCKRSIHDLTVLLLLLLAYYYQESPQSGKRFDLNQAPNASFLWCDRACHSLQQL